MKNKEIRKNLKRLKKLKKLKKLHWKKCRGTSKNWIFHFVFNKNSLIFSSFDNKRLRKIFATSRLINLSYTIFLYTAFINFCFHIYYNDYASIQIVNSCVNLCLKLTGKKESVYSKEIVPGRKEAEKEEINPIHSLLCFG